MTLQILQPLFAILAIVCLICLAVVTVRHRDTKESDNSSDKKRFPYQLVARIMFIGAIVSLCISLALAAMVSIAVKHGAYEFGDASVIDTIEHIAKSPQDESEKVPYKPKGMIIYMYRYACPDCEDIHNEMMEWLKASNKPYLSVSSRSKTGKIIRDSLSIDEVPAIIYFDNNGETHMKIAYERNGDTAVMNTAALSQIERYIKDDNI